MFNIKSLKKMAAILVCAVLAMGFGLQAFAEAGVTLEPDASVGIPETISEELFEKVTAIESESIENIAVYEEKEELREKSVKHFFAEDGLFVAVLYGEPVHYLKNEKWEDIDNTLVLAESKYGSVYKNLANSFIAELPVNISGEKPVVISENGYSLEIRLLGALEGEAHVIPYEEFAGKYEPVFATDPGDKLISRIVYESSEQNVALRYTLRPDRLKEDVVLYECPEEPISYRYEITAEGLFASANEDGSVSFRDAEGNDVFTILPMNMYDSADAYSNDVSVTFESGQNGKYVITYVPSYEWLSDETREYPVYIDPTVSSGTGRSNIADDTVCSGYPAYNYYNQTFLRTGTGDGRGINRSYFKVGSSLPTLAAGDVLIKAEFMIWKNSSGGNYYSFVDLYGVDTDFTDSGIRWNNKPAYNSTLIDTAIITSAQFYSFDITTLVNRWYEDDSLSHGFMLKCSDESNDYAQFNSAESAATDHLPCIYYIYRNTNGLYDNESYTVDMGSAGTAYINPFSGSFTVVRSDIGYDGERMPVFINSVLSAGIGLSWRCGSLWKTNYHQSAVTTIIGGKNYICYKDETNSTRYFIESTYKIGNETRTYYTPDSYTRDTGGTIEVDSWPTEYFEVPSGDLCYHDGSGLKYYFSTASGGRLEYIYDSASENSFGSNNIQDNFVTIAYKTAANAPTNTIDYILDGAGRVYKFFYNEGVMWRLAEIRYYGAADPSLLTSSTPYISNVVYTADNVVYAPVSVSGPNGSAQMSMFTSLSLMNSVFTDAETGDSFRFNYIGSKLHEVKYYSGNQTAVADETLTFEYGQFRTVITDSNDETVTMNFNSRGKLISASDKNGNGYFYEYGNNKAEGSINRLTLGSAPQNQTVNMLPDPSFEKNLTSFTVAGIDSGTGTGSRTMNIRHNGVFCYYLSKMNANGSIEASASFDCVPVDRDGVLTFSAWVKTFALLSGNPYIALELKDGTHTYAAKQKVDVAVSGEWSRVKVTVSFATASGMDETAEATVYLGITGGSGTVYFDDLQLTIGDNASQRESVVSNGDFNGTTGWTVTGTGTISTGNSASDYMNPSALMLSGNRTSQTRAYQNLPMPSTADFGGAVVGHEGDTVTFSAWAKANSLPLTKDTPRLFGVIVSFINDLDSSHSTAVYVQFNSHVDDWQYIYGSVSAEHEYHSIQIMLVYDYNDGLVYFDGVQAFIESAGTSYTYTQSGQIKEETDRKGTVYSYTYDADGQLASVTRTCGERTETVNVSHNTAGGVTNIETSADGVDTDTSAEYNAFGNTVLSKTTATKNNVSLISAAKSAYSSNGNYLEKSYDELWESYTEFGRDSDTGYLESVADNNGAVTEYTYDNRGRVTSVSADSGNSEVGYSYDTAGRLASITSASGVVYNFTYNTYGQTLSVTAGGGTLVTNSYLGIGQGGMLDTATYGNGHTVRYVYGNHGNNARGGVKNDAVTAIFYGNETSARYEFEYDSLGRLTNSRDRVSKLDISFFYTYDGDLAAVKTVGLNGQRGIEYSLSQTFDSENRVTAQSRTINGYTQETEYSYGADGSVTMNYVSGGTTYSSHTESDALGRPVSKTLLAGQSVLLENIYTYRSRTVGSDTLQSSIVSNMVIRKLGTNYKNYSYAYDYNGNITSITDGSYTTSYVYDDLGQLIRENDQKRNVTITYAYDAGGNILNKKTYAYTTSDNPGTPSSTINYTYNSTGWKDLLTSYNGQTITYDAIGNPTSYRGNTLTWEGRRLVNYNGYNYSYDSEGMRTRMWGGAGVYTNFIYENGKLIARYLSNENESATAQKVYFRYDENGSPLSINYNGNEYFYVLNLQGDIIAILDGNGSSVVEYSYDSWGKLLATTGTMATTLGADNPLRYRGYYYDKETGLYYLQSRYYDPETGRFLNADGYVSTGQGIVGSNMFAYCNNHPISYKDFNGESITIACIIIGAIAGLIIGAVGGSHYAKHKKNLTPSDGWEYYKYVLGFGIGGAAVGALVGWGVGAAVTAIGAYITAGSCGTLGTVIYSNWQQAEQAVRNAYNAVKHVFTIPNMSSRIVDGFNKAKGIIYEVKYGYASLSSFIQSEITRDVWLRENNSLVKTIEWHFYKSIATGLGGPSEPLLKALYEAGIKVVFH